MTLLALGVAVAILAAHVVSPGMNRLGWALSLVVQFGMWGALLAAFAETRAAAGLIAVWSAPSGLPEGGLVTIPLALASLAGVGLVLGGVFGVSLVMTRGLTAHPMLRRLPDA